MSKRFLDARMVRFAARAADESGRPESGASDADLAAINAQAGVLKPLAAGDLYVRECEAINDAPLKNGLRLGVAELARIAELSPGYGIHRNHDTWTAEGGLPIGRIFAARMESTEGRGVVIQRFYVLATDEGTDLVRMIDAGTIREVSVSFAYDALICSICETDMGSCAHWPGEEYDGKPCEGLVRGVTEYFETSLVWQGMANDTRIRMAASRQALCGESDLGEFLKDKPRVRAGLRPGFCEIEIPAAIRDEVCAMLAAAPETGMGYHAVVAKFEDGRSLECEALGGGIRLVVPESYRDACIVSVSLALAAMMTPRPLAAMFKAEQPLETLFTQ